jgi:hypothetical protein
MTVKRLSSSRPDDSSYIIKLFVDGGMAQISLKRLTPV